MIRGDASPVAGFDGPVNTALSLISRKSALTVPVPVVIVLTESVRSAPERVIFDPLSSTRTKSRRVLILLLLSVIRGLVVVLVKLDPS